jgi:hypothetical protein
MRKGGDPAEPLAIIRGMAASLKTALLAVAVCELNPRKSSLGVADHHAINHTPGPCNLFIGGATVRSLHNCCAWWVTLHLQ